MNRTTDKRQLIMQAAEKLFTSKRFHEITMDDIAAGAAVAKGTLYLYFRDKEDLFEQTCASGMEELCELLESKETSGASFDEQLLGVCRQISEFFERRHQLFRMMQTEEARISHTEGETRERWLERRKRLVAAVAGILSKGVSDGQIRGDVPPEALANILLAMLRTRHRDLRAFPEDMRRHEVIVDLFCKGAGAVSGGTTGEQ